MFWYAGSFVRVGKMCAPSCLSPTKPSGELRLFCRRCRPLPFTNRHLQVDLVKPADASLQYEQIRKFVAGTVADSSPIIPISAVKKLNIDVVCEYLVNRIPIPPRDFTSPPRLIVIRSFDVNKPGAEVDKLQGTTIAPPPPSLRASISTASDAMPCCPV